MYVTVEEVRAWHSDILANQSDAQITMLIALCSGIVEEYCGTMFAPTAEVFTADVSSKIRLPKGPLLKVDSVLYRGSLLAADIDYYVYPEIGLIELADTEKLLHKKRSLHIAYQYGYGETPAVVKKAVMDLMKLDIQSSDYNALASQENWDGEYSYQRNTTKTAEDLRVDILSMLDLFKQPEYKAVSRSVGDVRARLL